MDAWKKAGREVDSILSIPAAELVQEINAGNIAVEEVLDVRKPTEYLSEHLEGVESLPLDYLNRNMHKIDRDKTYYLHCQSGYRSMVAASILKARGFEHVADVAGGWKALIETDIARTPYVCPTTIPQEVLAEAVK